MTTPHRLLLAVLATVLVAGLSARPLLADPPAAGSPAVPPTSLPAAASPAQPAQAVVAAPAVATPTAATATTPAVLPPPPGPCRPAIAPIVLRSPLVEWHVSPCGAGLQSIRLLDQQYRVGARQPPAGVAAWAAPRYQPGPLDLVDTWDARWDPFRDVLESAEAKGPILVKAGDQFVPAKAARLQDYAKVDPIWGVADKTDRSVTLVWPDPARVKSPLYLTKRYHLPKADAPYVLKLEVAAWNFSAAPARVQIAHEIHTYQDPGSADGGFLAFLGAPPDLKGAGLTLAGETLHHDHGGLQSAEPADRDRVGLPSWMGVDSRYFLLASAPDGGFQAQNDVRLVGLPTGVVTARLKTPQESLPDGEGGCVPAFYASAFGGKSCRDDLKALGLTDLPEDAVLDSAALLKAGKDKGPEAKAAADRLQARGVKQWRWDLYTGPKEPDYLRPAGHELVESIDLGWFGAIAHPMLWVLKWGHNVTGSWPLAILILTVLVKALLWPITMRSMRSMRSMQKIKPELDKLRAELEARAKKTGQPMDPQELNRRTFELYRQHNVNPLGGCLPLLLQMPVYIALYRAINSSVSLFNQPLFGWITDLTHKDPYYVLPLVLGVVMFLQQKLTPQTGGDPAQQKMLLYFMPVLFTLMMLSLPSGLTLYILVNTVLSIVQTLAMQREVTKAA